jgi:hypothetical protein
MAYYDEICSTFRAGILGVGDRKTVVAYAYQVIAYSLVGTFVTFDF